MEYEIDFLPVGDPGEDGKRARSGDAISLRYGNLKGSRDEQRIVVIDGGYKSSGEALVQHIREYYGNPTFIDIVVSTHPHDDHIQGLFPVLESFRVKTLLIHKPWDHANGVDEMLADNRTNVTSMRARLKRSFQDAHDPCQLAISKNTNIVEPFQGVATPNGPLLVLGPESEFYHRCIAAELADQPIEGVRTLLSTFAEGAKRVMRTFSETWNSESLAEPAADAVDPLNHASTVILFDFAPDKVLFTADAGVQALNQAADFAAGRGFDLRQCKYVQIPHHGSKRNVGPKILDRILGARMPTGSATSKYAMLSSATDGEPKHPSARVTNAFLRRGAPGIATQGMFKWFHSAGAPPRPTWVSAQSIPFKTQYQDEE
jgi:beta-lactamase superfamily II metal-dependent hydrolase